MPTKEELKKAKAKEKLDEARKKITAGTDDQKNTQIINKTIQLSALDIQEQEAIDSLIKKSWEEWKPLFPNPPPAAGPGVAAAAAGPGVAAAVAGAGAAAAPVATPDWLTDWITKFEPTVKSRVDFVVPGIKEEFYKKVLEATKLLVMKDEASISKQLAEVVASALVIQASATAEAAAAPVGAAAAGPGAAVVPAAAAPVAAKGEAVIEILRIIQAAAAAATVAAAAAAAAPAAAGAAAAAAAAAAGAAAAAPAVKIKTKKEAKAEEEAAAAAAAAAAEREAAAALAAAAGAGARGGGGAAGAGGGGGAAAPPAPAGAVGAAAVSEAIRDGTTPIVKKEFDHIIYEGVLEGWKYMVKAAGSLIGNEKLSIKDFMEAVLKGETVENLQKILENEKDPLKTGETKEDDEDEDEDKKDESKCHEKNIKLPDNKGALCWWLSVNFALFHKERQELEDFFNPNYTYNKLITKDKETLFKSIKDNLNRIYQYYNGTIEEKEIEFITKDLASKAMQDIFNNDMFKIGSGEYQDATEYLQTLFLYIDQIPLVSLTKDSNILTLYEINLFRKFYGYQESDTTNLRGPATRRPARRYNKNTQTLLFSYNRRSHTDKSETNPVGDYIFIKETITVPLFKTEETNRDLQNRNDFDPDLPDVPIKAFFKLDAAVIGIPGHFTAVVKCSDTWVDYNAMGGTEKRPVYKSFEEMVKAKNLNTTAVILFYTRVSS